MSTYTSRELYLRLLQHVRPHWRMFGIALIGMVLTGASEPLFPALMQPLLDGSFVKRDTSNLYLIPAAVIGVFVLRGILTFVSSYAMSWVSNRLLMDLRESMFASLLRQPTRYYDDHSTGVLISKVSNDVSGMISAATSVLTILVRESIKVVGLLGWLLWLNWKLTMVTLLVVPGIALAIRLFSKRLRGLSQAGMKAMGHLTQVLEESISCQKVIKVFGGQPNEIRRFSKASQTLRGYAMRQTIAAAATVPISQLFAAVALAIIIVIAVGEASSNALSVGGFVSYITAMLMLLAPLKHLADVNAPLQQGLASAQSVFELLDAAPEPDQGTLVLGRLQGRIEMQQVSFAYPQSRGDALQAVDLRIEPGQTIALVGPSGGGKSTLVNMLPRFYEPHSGRILFDGVDYTDATLTSLRANIALVSQDVSLFNDTVAANIAYGRGGKVTREEVERAAQAAHALEFIRDMPMGFDTLIGENGVRLSGGQRQRLAIARALLKDAPILLLDEATSALDSESEQHVQAALTTLMQGRTTLVIAHRLSTIEHADRIVVMQRGRIAESGSHAELMAREGLYARLYRIQFALGSDESGVDESGPDRLGPDEPV